MPANFEVRGEVVLPQAAFEKMNDQRVAQGLAPAVNPAQRRRRHHPHARAQHRRPAPARLLRLLPAPRRTEMNAGEMLLPTQTAALARAAHRRLPRQPARNHRRLHRRGARLHRTSRDNCATRSVTRSTASSSRSTPPPSSAASASPAKRRAGLSPTSSPPAPASPNSRMCSSQRWPHRQSHARRRARARLHRRHHRHPRHPA